MTEYMSVCLCQKKLEYILVGGGHPKYKDGLIEIQKINEKNCMRTVFE